MKKIYQWAVGQSFKKLDPRQQIKNPVMFVVYLGAIITTILCFYPMRVPVWFSISITVFLWLTLLLRISLKLLQKVVEKHRQIV